MRARVRGLAVCILSVFFLCAAVQTAQAVHLAWDERDSGDIENAVITFREGQNRIYGSFTVSNDPATADYLDRFEINLARGKVTEIVLRTEVFGISAGIVPVAALRLTGDLAASAGIVNVLGEVDYLSSAPLSSVAVASALLPLFDGEMVTLGLNAGFSDDAFGVFTYQLDVTTVLSMPLPGGVVLLLTALGLIVSLRRTRA